MSQNPPETVIEVASHGLFGVAGQGANHPTLTSKEICYGTPHDLFRELNHEFGFTVDVCASDGHEMVAKHFTPEQDGLMQDWADEVCWMNPPYGKTIGHWMRKAMEESKRGATVVALVPARTDAGWFHDFVKGEAEIRYLRGRLKFRGIAGAGLAHGQQAPFASILCIYSPNVQSPPTGENEA